MQQIKQFLLDRFSAEARAKRRVNLEPRGDIWLASDDDLEWLVPDPNPGHLLWVKLFQSKNLRFEDRNLISPGDTVIDVGACSGEWTVYASRCAGPSGRVIAFEPDPDHFACLVANMELHGCSNVECVQLALSDKPGETELHRIDGTLAGGSLDTGYNEQHAAIITDHPRVKAVRLDDWFKSIPEISVMSVTVNLFEPEVLKGAKMTLSKTRHVISQSPRHAEVKQILSGFEVVEEIPQGGPEYIALFSK